MSAEGTLINREIEAEQQKIAQIKSDKERINFAISGMKDSTNNLSISMGKIKLDAEGHSETNG